MKACSLAFGIVFYFTNIPAYLAFVFGGIALATAPAPALSIVNEFHAKEPVTDTLLPMTILDDVVGIALLADIVAPFRRIFGIYRYHLFHTLFYPGIGKDRAGYHCSGSCHQRVYCRHCGKKGFELAGEITHTS